MKKIFLNLLALSFIFLILGCQKNSSTLNDHLAKGKIIAITSDNCQSYQLLINIEIPQNIGTAFIGDPYPTNYTNVISVPHFDVSGLPVEHQKVGVRISFEYKDIEENSEEKKLFFREPVTACNTMYLTGPYCEPKLITKITGTY